MVTPLTSRLKIQSPIDSGHNSLSQFPAIGLSAARSMQRFSPRSERGERVSTILAGRATKTNFLSKIREYLF